MRYKLIIVGLVVVAVLLAIGLSIPIQAAPRDAQPTSIPTTIPYDLRPVPGDAVSKDLGGVFESGIAVEGDADEPMLILKEYSGQAEDALNIQNASGVDVFAVEADGEVVVIGVPRVISKAITYTAATGGSGTVMTIPAGEIYLIHNVVVSVTTNFDCTGDDATFTVGDGLDADGFIVLADANLQAADTEATGFSAGWQGLAAATRGVYLDEVTTNAYTGGFIYEPAADETIDYLVSEASGDTLTAGALSVFVTYTRLQ